MTALLAQIKNTGSLTIAKMLRPIFSFFLIKMIASYLGPEGHGQYAILFNYIILFEIISAFGIKRLMTREVARDKDKFTRLYVSGSIMLVPIAVIAMISLIGLVKILGWAPELRTAAWILSASLLASSLVECSEGVLIGLEKMKIVGLVWAIENFLRAGISILFIYNGYGLRAIVIVYVVLKYLMLFSYYIYMSGFFKMPDKIWDKQIFLEIFGTAKTFALIVFFVMLYWKIDMLMLKEIKGDEAVAVYDGAYRFFQIIIILISNFILSIFPAFSNAFKTSIEGFCRVIFKTLKIFLIFAVPLVILLAAFSNFLILGLFNAEYTESVKILIILSFAIIPYGMTEIFSHMLLASMKQKIDLRINAIGMLVNICLNLLLIPKFSYIGASLATLFSINVYLIIQLIYINKVKLLFDIRNQYRVIMRFIFSAGVFTAAVFLLYSLKIFYLSLLALPLYFFLIWKMKVISVDDKQMIAQMIKKS